MRKVINPQELHQRLAKHDPVQVVDVRTTAEYASGHIPGAMNMPMDEVESRLEDMALHQEVVLVCHSGARATMTCDQIKDRVPDAIVLNGGTAGWESSGLPLVRSTSSSWALDRQVRLLAGSLVLIGVILGLLVNHAWIYLSGAVGFGMTAAALTNVCPMGMLLTAMPWNKAPKSATGHAGEACTG